MGDGQHIWAAAEWALMVRNCFVREESDRLVVGSGLRPEWWREKGCSLGPTLTPFGAVTIRVIPTPTGARVKVEGRWRQGPPRLTIALPGCGSQETSAGAAREEFDLVQSPA